MTDQILLVAGIVMLVAGVSAFLHPSYFHSVIGNYTSNPALMFINGVIMLVIGSFIVLNHNIWVQDWAVVVTIIGWLAIARGLLHTLAPKFVIKVTKSKWFNISHLKTDGVFMIAFGVILIYITKLN